MASQFLWTSKSVDLLHAEHENDGACVVAASQKTYYAGKSKTFRAVAASAHWKMLGCKSSAMSLPEGDSHLIILYFL